MYHQPGLPWDREIWDFDGFFVAMPPSLVSFVDETASETLMFSSVGLVITLQNPKHLRSKKHLLQVFKNSRFGVVGILNHHYSPDIEELHPFPRIPKIPVAVSTLEMSWPEMLLLMVQKSGVPVEVRSLSHYLQGILYIPGGCFRFVNQQQ